MKNFLNKNDFVGINKGVILLTTFFVYIFGFSCQVGAQTSISKIESNIKNLAEMGQVATISGYWLLNEGDTILPYAHKALLNADNSLLLKVQLMNVLGGIADRRSVEPIIKAVQKQTELISGAFLALAKIPETKASFSFAVKQLEDKQTNYSGKRGALWFFSQHKDKRALKWMKKILDENNNKLEDAALYLSAILGDESVKARIFEKLYQIENTRASDRYTLLRAFAAITKPQEFNSGTAIMDQSNTYYQSAKRLNAYKFGDTDQRIEIANKMLKSRFSQEKEKAVQFLLSHGQTSSIDSYLDSIYGRNQVRLNSSVFIDKDGDSIPK